MTAAAERSEAGGVPEAGGAPEADAMTETGERGDLLWDTIPKLLQVKASEHPDAVAIADTDRDLEFTFAELLTSVEQAGRAFIALGIQPDDRVAVWAPNIAEWVVAAIGLQAAGGVLVPLNTRFKGREAGYVLQKSGARMLLCTREFLDTDYVALLEEAHGPATPSGRWKVCLSWLKSWYLMPPVAVPAATLMAAPPNNPWLGLIS